MRVVVDARNNLNSDVLHIPLLSYFLYSSGPLIQLPYMYAHKEDHERAEFYDNAGFDLSSILGLAMFGTAVSVAGGEGGGGGDCCGDIDCGDMCGEVCTIL